MPGLSAARAGARRSSPSDDVAAYYAARVDEYDATAGYQDLAAEQRRIPVKPRFHAALRGLDVLEIACGTGYWTAVIATAARSVVAIDLDPVMVAVAERRLAGAANVRCVVADAYSLEGVGGPFNAAFAHWWWSHVPKSRLRPFLTTLHTRLTPGAFVLFADQLPYAWKARRHDAEGNILEARTLRSGAVFEIVKNFPTEPEVVHVLRERARTVVYRAFPAEGAWTVSYRTR
jgi:SAM-dependent methyltransferase